MRRSLLGHSSMLAGKPRAYSRGMRLLFGFPLLFAGVMQAQTCQPTEVLFVAQNIHRLHSPNISVAMAELWPTDRNDQPISFGDGIGTDTKGHLILPVVNGAITPICIPRSDSQTRPVYYHFTLKSATSEPIDIARIPVVPNSGANFDLGAYNYANGDTGTIPSSVTQAIDSQARSLAANALSVAGQALGVVNGQASVAGVVNAANSAGGDIGAKINNAFASLAGVPSSRVTLPPGNTYNVTTPITMPGDQAGNHYVDFDCQGSTLTGSFAGSMLTVLGANANAPYSTGGLRNCTIINNGTGPVVTVLGRLGFAIRYNNFIGTGDNVQLVNTNQNGGPGYSEEDVVSDNGFSIGGVGNAGIHHIISTGGSNSFDYNWEERNHCQLGNGTWCEIFDNGTDAQGLNIGMHINTGSGGSADTGAIWVKGAFGLSRSTVDIRGENTAQIAAGHLWTIYGGPTYLVGSVLFTGASVGAGNVVQLPNNTVTNVFFPAANVTVPVAGFPMEDENGPAGDVHRRSEHIFSPNLTLWGLRRAGAENRGEFYLLNCDGSQEHALQSNCNSSLYATGLGGVGIGTGFGTYYTPGGVLPQAPLHVRGNGYVAIQESPNNPSTIAEFIAHTGGTQTIQGRQYYGEYGVDGSGAPVYDPGSWMYEDEVNHVELRFLRGTLGIAPRNTNPATVDPTSGATCLNMNSIMWNNTGIFHCDNSGHWSGKIAWGAF